MISTSTITVVLAIIASVALFQSDVQKYPPAIVAPEKRPEICSPEPLQTPVAKWADGTLVADMVIGPDGKVVGLTVVKSSYGEPETKAAIAALREWRFKPAYLRGYYVTVHLIVEMTIDRSSVSVRIPDFAQNRGCKASPFPN